MFPYANKIIDSCVDNNMNKQEIINYCKSRNAILTKEIYDTFDKNFEKIKMRENNWDIKVSDFIKNNYKRYKLFYDFYHPTNVLLMYIGNKILEIIVGENESLVNADKYSCLDAYELSIYPIVKETLGLEYEEKYIRKSRNARKLADKMTFEEYISEYLFWCHNIS